ncbi:inositol monophosphatase [bacterium]|nr:inositol monophosphatase [bacterium]
MNLENITKSVGDLLLETGEFLLRQRQLFSPDKVRIKNNNIHDLVSYVDLDAEQRLMKTLRQLLPEAGFITEETNSSYQGGLNWVIDPLDGTTNFVQGIPFYCISVALVDDNELLLGVVYEPNTGQCFYSWQGAASFCNKRHISVSATQAVNNAFVATGFSVKNIERLPENLKWLRHWVEYTRGVRRLGAAALDLCCVAKGVFDVFYETNLSAWDVAAGALIVQNAGGQVSDFSGGNHYLFGDEIMASNKLLHSQILQIMQGL